ncbi:MAG: hypothetical protein OEO20_06185 [Gemmatimonadota bacterium]|nr:hypothetical protein [Gemmatimonadota bacterium]MDH3368670.1 hypothetical protein [Gemmatimonadota bacterium]MDH3477873.1 hypothetical protein [Gemmatimonadota bacterium]MDH3568667.1 hypothetical protein [Gemmatimonadota bacterium]MDH5549567.1 hypothetical protein [Gemmatimonadota bacterium]
MPDTSCAVPAQRLEGRELRERVKAIEAELRDLDPEEGYEWPCSDKREAASPADAP